MQADLAQTSGATIQATNSKGFLTMSGLGPVRVGAHMGPYESSWTGLGRSGHVRFPTFGRISHVSGPQIILTKFINDSAWFLLEKLKKHIIFTRNLNI